ncbi:MAG: tetratricopeptide repeat protein [Treponema sp.]|nr:tetratricopeptide repeat protein [Treponema sp.]
MKKAQNRSEISAEAMKKRVFQGLTLILALAALGMVLVFLFIARIRGSGVKKTLLANWESGSWETAYEKSRDGLASKPMDSFFLIMNGFSAYQAALAQVNNAESLDYIDESIQSLRKALLEKNADRDGRIRYVLGKAYYAKGPGYADLAVKYLEEAKAASFAAGDLNEYLGLSYAAIKDYRKSIEAFSDSLAPLEEEGAPLLLYIARSYMGMEEWETARAYLQQCADTSLDVDLALKARLLLGKTLVQSGNEDGAIAIFESVLEIGGENAEASFELGEIYASRGDFIRARAAWRRAIRADLNFEPARVRLNAM